MCGSGIMVIGISPTVDFAFKLMPRSTEQPRVTVHFLNSILVDQPRITPVEILNPFLEKDRDNDKLARGCHSDRNLRTRFP